MADNLRSYWNTKEAAAHIGVHPHTLRAYCRGKTNGTREAKDLPRTAIPPHAIFGRRSLKFPIEAFRNWALRRTITPEGSDDACSDSVSRNGRVGSPVQG